MRERIKILLQILVLVVICGGVVAVLLLSGVMAPPSEKRTLTFRVEAMGGYANITLDAGTEKISQTTTVTTPWQKTLQVERGVEVYLTASNPSQTGQLSCTILLDRQLWKQDKTEAPKDGVACAGIVP
ncbi:MAG TPA: hypothetical protein DEQ80_00425 [Anaerolinea thermolimosa]|uniref:Uncharacterized protein n=1 Tax=Anaerolinea thermolimosa TaxID=229919 RepID=A0A3D1JEW6_9CHLR|nr:hypothetical protein [Anaerolinea thermolimosa]GAP07885.1 hypothetical protein ATHL_02781 [Anaerolinea thermolimosa]HCE16298.1 hypothetical protein [Anaerolinea thermolimosa]